MPRRANDPSHVSIKTFTEEVAFKRYVDYCLLRGRPHRVDQVEELLVVSFVRHGLHLLNGPGQTSEAG